VFDAVKVGFSLIEIAVSGAYEPDWKCPSCQVIIL